MYDIKIAHLDDRDGIGLAVPLLLPLASAWFATKETTDETLREEKQEVKFCFEITEQIQ